MLLRFIRLTVTHIGKNRSVIECRVNQPASDIGHNVGGIIVVNFDRVKSLTAPDSTNSRDDSYIITDSPKLAVLSEVAPNNLACNLIGARLRRAGDVWILNNF